MQFWINFTGTRFKRVRRISRDDINCESIFRGYEGISTFGEIHYKKLKRLRIMGNEHIFPIASFMRLGSPVKYEFHIEFIGNYDREILIKLVIPVK